jgi:Na+/melibiose symporter-like transporter
LANALVHGGPTAAARMAPGDRLVILPALSHAFQIVFLVAGAIALVCFVLTFFLREERLKTHVPTQGQQGH